MFLMLKWPALTNAGVGVVGTGPCPWPVMVERQTLVAVHPGCCVLAVASVSAHPVNHTPAGMAIAFATAANRQFRQCVVIAGPDLLQTALVAVRQFQHGCVVSAHSLLSILQFGIGQTIEDGLIGTEPVENNTNVGGSHPVLKHLANAFEKAHSGNPSFTGDCSNSNADGRPSSVANAIRLANGERDWASVQRASLNFVELSDFQLALACSLCLPTVPSFCRP